MTVCVKITQSIAWQTGHGCGNSKSLCCRDGRCAVLKPDNFHNDVLRVPEAETSTAMLHSSPHMRDGLCLACMVNF